MDEMNEMNEMDGGLVPDRQEDGDVAITHIIST